ncbi:MAG: hypothetical protein ACLQVD_12620, partial [Capsulimonadaceae bacterium]
VWLRLCRATDFSNDSVVHKSLLYDPSRAIVSLSLQSTESVHDAGPRLHRDRMAGIIDKNLNAS